jgi:hypothetical protein
VTATVISWRRFFASIALSVLYGNYDLPGPGRGWRSRYHYSNYRPNS